MLILNNRNIMKKSVISFLGISSLFTFGKPPYQSISDGENIPKKGFIEQDENHKIADISPDFEFAGQKVPMTSPSVKRRFAIELTTSKYWRFIATNLTLKS